MDDGSSIPGSTPDLGIDLDFMDELFLDGCWLETSSGSDYVGSSFRWPIPDPTNCELPMDLSKIGAHEVEKGNCHDALVTDGGSEPCRKIWIAPGTTPLASGSVMERLMAAISQIRQSITERNVLVQIWVPENRGGKCVLSTHDDLFALDPSSWKLASYRQVSANYNFSAEENSQFLAGMPGRVFLGKIPEWTPDVRFFKSDEYPRVDHAHKYEVSGSLALPVFEQGSKTCLGVIEVITTEQKIKYHPELEMVCNALEAVDLRSSEALRVHCPETADGSYETVLPEIQELLRYACKTHGLPLAQTWVPCSQQRKEGCRHSDENYANCVSTVDNACYVGDPGIQAFHEACSEYHLLKGQGVAGEAFMTNQPCFSSDITSYTKTQYPLAHHAKVFNMCAAVAIRLRGLHSGKADFVLEFFLPVNCRNLEEQKEMLTSLSNVIRRVCQTLRVVTSQELQDEGNSFVFAHSEGGSSAEKTIAERQQKRVLSTCQSNKVEAQCSKKPREEANDWQENNVDTECVGISGSYNIKGGEKKRNKTEKLISLDVIRQYFAGSLKDAAKSIGVCPTTLKRICRRHGIQRWPSRKIKKVGNSLQKIQDVIDSVQGASDAVKISPFCKDFNVMVSPDAFIHSSNANPATSRQQTEGETAMFKFGQPRSPLSPCSHENSSSQSCSGGSQSPYSMINPSANSGPEDRTAAATMKRGGSYPELRSQEHDATICKFGNMGSINPGFFRRVGSNREIGYRDKGAVLVMPRSQSHLSLMQQPNAVSHGTFISAEGDDNSYRVKVSYDNEKVRFRMPNNWGFLELQKEISVRFSISDTSKIDIKYLDDDSEWVLLTCDADLRECILISLTSENSTIRLMLTDSSARGSKHLVGGSRGA